MLRAAQLVSIAAALAAALIVERGLAHAPGAYGIGSRGAAMASAVAADATDFSAGYYNPAGLVGATGLSLSLGYAYTSNDLRMNGAPSGTRDVHGLAGGLVAPGAVAGIPFAFGLSTFIPDEGLSRIKALRQETPRWELYDDRLSILFLAANLAVRPFPWLEVGGGLAFLASTRGGFQVTGRASVLSPYESKLEHEVDADLTTIRYPQLGLRVKAGDLGFVGLTYRGEAQLPLSIDANLDGVIDFAGVEVPLAYALESRTIDGFLPQQVVLGLSFQRIERLKINVDLTWVNWSAYESPVARTRAHLAVETPPGLDIDLPEDPRPTVAIPLEFRDRFVPRVGVEYVWPVAGPMRQISGEATPRRALEVPLRAGYVYERSPIPPQTGATNYVDVDRHTMSLGAGLWWNRPGAVLQGALRLDVHGQLSVLPEQVTEKANPADFIGDFRAGGTMISAGGTLTAAF
ncbi:OmpP1/FadL family transporter [Chondromyces apiculatus]|uniref:Long-chain fatty acid transport protein-like protein n=1 Tax=Chondromyces apiculatus DSM 436 TaxID=1192034 RepID=A0A017TF99_9BACT|nr:outer membrane protein transport protein [Chondromyces apiculatus]EYF07968.1 Long-chain fatty acid transport protein-like protein [Chondromyces apiculatus DSM 436]